MAGKRRGARNGKSRKPSQNARHGSTASRAPWVVTGALVAVALVVLAAAFVYGRTRSASQQAGPTAPRVATPGVGSSETSEQPARASNEPLAPGGPDETTARASSREGADQIAQRDTTVVQLRAQVLSERHHDPSAFTQGLVLDGGWLYESTGMFGESTLREVDPQTGDVQRQTDLAPELFGEGLALVGDRLVQLTWRAQIALEYEKSTFDQTTQHTYAGEGWGLCFDGERLVMSDGSSDLTFRDPDTFDELARLSVTLAGQPVPRLNELECVDGSVYANVWQTDDIVEIDAVSGQVRAVIDASGLLTPDERNQADVLNGIAYDPDSDTFLITGKWWPKLFEVRFVPHRQAYLPGVVTGF